MLSGKMYRLRFNEEYISPKFIEAWLRTLQSQIIQLIIISLYMIKLNAYRKFPYYREKQRLFSKIALILLIIFLLNSYRKGFVMGQYIYRQRMQLVEPIIINDDKRTDAVLKEQKQDIVTVRRGLNILSKHNLNIFHSK